MAGGTGTYPFPSIPVPVRHVVALLLVVIVFLAYRKSGTVIDDGGMSCEDLILADLNGDGKLDIAAAGRATKNVKVYWNESQ